MAVKELRSGGRAVGTMVRLIRNPGIAWIAGQAELLAGWCKFTPEGKRGLGSIGTHTNFAAVKAGETPGFMSAANEQVLAIAQIEIAEAIEEIEGIAAVPGVDVLLIGPNDLAVSLGCTGELQNPKVLAGIDKVAEAAGRYGKIFGMHGPDALMERYLDRGLRLIMSKLDINMLLGAMGEIAAKWKDR